MSLTPEWRKRIERWEKVLQQQIYDPISELSLEGFITQDQLSPEDAMGSSEFKLFPVGTKWGMAWEYGWFRTRVVIPEQARGQRVVVQFGTTPECIAVVNGRNAGARDREHHTLTLSRSAQPGERYDILIESYAGHGPRVCGGGPAAAGTETVPPVTKMQAEIGETTFGAWSDEIYHFRLELELLLQLRDNLDQDSLRVAQIDDALRDSTVISDLELPREAMIVSVKKARKRLKSVLDLKNGPTMPEFFAFGHAHLDTAWLWPLAETERKAVRTFSNQLTLLEEYPEYKFLASQPYQYRMLKEHYPDLYQRVKEAVASGMVIPEGAMWVEADTNVPCGESLIRQFIHGKRFFREEFGVDNEMLWLPDVFGYSGSLPQIMQGCGVKYFSTAKIFWNYNGGDPFPYNTFTWEGIDGSKVLVHLCNDYNAKTDPASLITRWNQRVQKDGISTRLYPFGWGDGGGGPTRDHLEYLRRETDLEGLPRVTIASPVEYFKDLERRGIPDALYIGELYYQCHRGTYTTQAKTKKGNRKSEFALREAEMWGALARITAGHPFSSHDTDELWKKVLLNQFHDIIPGSSIARVYDEAEKSYGEVIADAGKLTNSAIGSLTKEQKADQITFFNSLSWERTAIVSLPGGFEGATDISGNSMPVQLSGSRMMAEIALPPCGCTTLHSGKPADSKPVIKITTESIENDVVRLEIDCFGQITSILDKETGHQWATGLCNSFRMYKDVPSSWDAWDIDSIYKLTPVDLRGEAKIEIAESGPLIGILRVSRVLNESVLHQEIVIRRGSRRIDFRTRIDWNESHKLLKVNFPVDVRCDTAKHEIQFGHLCRPTHSSRPFDADQFEVSAHKWSALCEPDRGFALLNDCKYGLNVDRNSINLTLLKSPLAPDMHADKGVQEFTYALYFWNGSFAKSDVIREAYELNAPVVASMGNAGDRSFFSVSAPNVIIETVKAPEDGGKGIVVRLYESKRMSTRCRLNVSFPITTASLTNMLEEQLSDLGVHAGSIDLEFGPFEVKTIRMQ